MVIKTALMLNPIDALLPVKLYGKTDNRLNHGHRNF